MIAHKTILVDAWNTLFTQNGIDENLHTLLEQFPHQKIVLTNANEEEQKRFGMTASPYPFFTLRHQPDKPDPEYYRRMLAHFGLAASDVVYFEHNPAAVASAESVGITTLHFDKTERDIGAVEAFLRARL